MWCMLLILWLVLIGSGVTMVVVVVACGVDAAVVVML